MAPRKEVKSLYDLSIFASRELVLATAEKISVLFPCETGLTLDVAGCQDTVQVVQDFLRDALLPVMWEPLFHAVTEKGLNMRRQTDITDERLLFSIFTYDNVNLEKLTLRYECITNLDEIMDDFSNEPKPATVILRNERNVEFWLKSVPKLTELIKVDLSHVSNDDVILAFSRNCTKLQVMRCVSIKPETLEEVIRTSTNLLNLDCHFDERYIGNLITAGLEKDCKLKLKSIFLHRVTAEQFQLALDVCPDLVDLQFHIETVYYDEVMKTLESNPMRFSRLRLPFIENHEDVFNSFMTNKGAFITELILYHGDSITNNPLLLMPVISDKCKQLTKLEIMSCWIPTSQEEATQLLAQKISFPKLQELQVEYLHVAFLGDIALINLAKHCIEDSTELSSLTIVAVKSEPNELQQVEEALFQMFTEAASQLKQLQKLNLTTCFLGVGMSERLVKKCYMSCPSLTSLRLAKVDQDAKTYLQTLSDLAKFNNEELKLNYLSGNIMLTIANGLVSLG